MKRLLSAAVLVGLAVYLAAFYATPLPGLSENNGPSLNRIQEIGLLLLRPEDNLFPYWFGSPPQFTLVDRLPVLLGAGAILAWAFLLGWLLLKAIRADRGLTRLEIAVFSIVVGLNTLGTWALLMGLLGLLDRTWLITVPAAITLAAACVCFWRQHAKSLGQTAGHVPLLRRSSAGSDLPPNTACKQAVAHGENDDDIMGTRWLLLGLPFVLAILLAAMLPPLDFDVCEYHLQAPKEFFQQGRITFLPHNVYANMPLGAEMLSLLGMVMADDWWWGALIGKTAIAAFTPLCALAIFAAGRRWYSTSAGVIGSLIYISIPWIVSVSAAGLIEGVSACYLFLALYALLLLNEGLSRTRWGGSSTATLTKSAENMDLFPWRPEGDSPIFAAKTSVVVANSIAPRKLGQSPAHSLSLVALSGYLAGGAVATKYPAVLFVLVPLAAWAFVGCLGREKRKGEKNNLHTTSATASPLSLRPSPFARSALLSATLTLTVFLLAAAIGCGLWFGKNWALTGNPTYPLLYNVFGGKTWNADKDLQWNKVHRAQDFSLELLGKDLGKVLMTSELYSPLVVPLAVLAFIPFYIRRKGTVPFSSDENRDSPPSATSRRLRWGLLAYIVFFFAVWWLLTHRITRFWLPTLPLFALLAGVGATWNNDRWWRCFLLVLLLTGLTANFLLSSAGVANAWFVPLERLRVAPGWLSPWHGYLNQYSSLGGVLMVGDAAAFDMKAPVFYNTCFDDCVFEQIVCDKTNTEIREKTNAEIRAEFAARKIAFVYVNWDEIARYRRTYGYTNYVKPDVFERLVERGILAPLTRKKELPEQIYRVRP
jgi:hypothetical protein